MAATPLEVFEAHQRANQPVHQQPDFVRTAQRNPTYQGYSREASYRNTATHRPNARPRPATQQETSFTSGQRERNPNVRQRRGNTRPRPPTRQEQFEHTRNTLRARGETRINIPYEPLSESTALLPSVSAAGASGGILSGVGSTLGGVGAAGAALGAGVLTTSIANRYKNKGAVLPGSNYIGPGNPLDAGEPTGDADKVAQVHDHDYQDIINQAKEAGISRRQFQEAIRKADDRAIEKFWNVWDTTHDWKAAVGYLGLRIKAGVEHHTGVLYPSFSGKIWYITNHLPIKGLIGIG